jgi:hypothetical protein
MNGRVLAWTLWGCSVALTAVFVFLAVLSVGTPGRMEFDELPVFIALYAGLMLLLPSTGAVIAARRPDNSIGWLFIASGIAMAAGFSGQLYADQALFVRPGLPAGGVAGAVGAPLSIVGLACGALFPAFLFPTGRPLSAGWRRVFAGLLTLFGVGISGMLLSARLGVPFEDVANPLAIPGFAEVATRVGTVALETSAPLAFLLAAAAVATRFRRSRGVERMQMKWFVYTAGFVAASMAVGGAVSKVGLETAPAGGWVNAQKGSGLFKVGLGVAVLRYRLYEIDRLISRTVSYGLLTAALVGVYAGVVLLLAPVVGRGSDLAVAGATLAVAAAFQPARRPIHAGVARRMKRAPNAAARHVARVAPPEPGPN